MDNCHISKLAACQQAVTNLINPAVKNISMPRRIRFFKDMDPRFFKPFINTDKDLFFSSFIFLCNYSKMYIFAARQTKF